MVLFAPDYLMKHYSDLNKQTYIMLLSSYYRDGCRQSSTGIIWFYYGCRGNDLKESDLTLKEALKLIKNNQYTVYCFHDVSDPHILTHYTDIVFNEVKS